MKKIFSVLVVLLVMLLSACQSSSILSGEQTTHFSDVISEEQTTYSSDVASPRTLEESGAAVYFDRELERQELHEQHNDLDLDEFIETLNHYYFQEFFEISGTLDLRSTTLTPQGIKYFTGIDIDKINQWLDTNPFGLSEEEREEKKKNFNFAHASRNVYHKLIQEQWDYAMGQYIDFVEMNRWIQDNPNENSLDNFYARYLSGDFVDNQGEVNENYWREKKRLIERAEKSFESFLLDDEREVFGGYLSDIKVDTTLHVYNYDGAYVFPISASFSVPHPENDYNIEGRLYLVVQGYNISDYQADYNVLDRFVLFYNHGW